jgi:hypothetical protein
MPYRTMLIAAAALVAASPAFAQQTTDPPAQPPPVSAQPATEEPNQPSRSREEVYVTAARPIPVQKVEGATTLEQRQQDREEGRCVLRAQSVDPTEPDFGIPEDVCRGS